MTPGKERIQNAVVQAMGGIGPGQGRVPLQRKPMGRAVALPEKLERRQSPLHPGAPGCHPRILRQGTAEAQPSLRPVPDVVIGAPGGNRSAIHRHALTLQLLPGEGSDSREALAETQLLPKLALLATWTMTMPAFRPNPAR